MTAETETRVTGQEWAGSSAAELRTAYSSGTATPTEVLAEVLQRIETDKPLNPYHAVLAQQAQAAAEASDRRWAQGQPAGPLDGVPVTIKENMHYRGVSYPGGWAAENPPIAETDCPLVSRLKEAGAVIVGSTTMPDLGMLSSGVSSRHGITRNAWDPSWTTGGSSAGAAVTAAAGHGPIHMGSDIGGSVRLPGTWSGLATLKPSHGLIPLDAPYYGRAAGPMARRTDDLYLAMATTGQFDTADTTAQPYPACDWTPNALEPRGLRVGLQLDGGPGLPTDPEVRTTVEAAAEKFAEAGAEIVEISPIATDEYLTGIDQFWRSRAWSQYRGLAPEEKTVVLDYIAEWAQGGAQADGATAVEGYEAMLALGSRARNMTAGLDLLLSPVTPVLAFPAELPMPDNDPSTPMAHISYTVPFNMSGQPSGSVNAGRSEDGRWIGLQLTGQMGQDPTVLGAMKWWEAVRDESAAPAWQELERSRYGY
ncbi:amidase [Nesterenkonia sp. MY13]|uniref:Amidase n=1 Tax=Nesterenkonia sedimenti TaxID=1463632 RepID=A0A7X8YE81_9MICC|nr:amidase [Nesterenkonia sedimenti]NLS10359.1 amidase [Nesterenkonia sedimenti]